LERGNLENDKKLREGEANAGGKEKEIDPLSSYSNTNTWLGGGTTMQQRVEKK